VSDTGPLGILFTFADAVWIRYVTGRNIEQPLL